MSHRETSLILMLAATVIGCNNTPKNNGAGDAPTELRSFAEPELTTLEHFTELDENESYCYGSTPDGLTFYLPSKDLPSLEIVSKARDYYNIALVRDMIVNDYEWMRRQILDEALENDDNNVPVDTVGIAKEHQIVISEQRLREAISDETLRSVAREALKKYNEYDGRENGDGPIFFQSKECKALLKNLLNLSSDETLHKFENSFWTWYDKHEYVPEIDSLTRKRISGSNLHPELSEEETTLFKNMVQAEREINRRTILAIEYTPYDPSEGVFLLGEILESGTYTKYLLEAYINWRAYTQEQFFGSSSMSRIPNDLYNKVKAKCVETILRHYIQSEDPFDLCLIDNLIGSGILVRFGWMMGNEATPLIYSLQESYFLPPEMVEE